MFVPVKCLTLRLELTELPENDDGKVRTYLGTQRAAGAFFLVGNMGRSVSLIVYPVTQHQQLSGTGNGAQSASLAPCLLDLDRCHI